MVLIPIPVPVPTPFLVARLVALKGSVTLLLLLLIKSRLQIKFFSALGLLLALIQTLIFLAAAGGVGLTLLGGSILYGKSRNQTSS
jgi:hypothetical protein